MRRLWLVAVLLSWTGGAVAETVPLPRPRPPEIGGAPAAAPEDDAQKSAEKKPDEPPPPSACFTRLRELAVVKQLPNISQPSGCGASDVVQLEAVILPDAGKVAIEPASIFRCEMAAALTDWVREELAAVAADTLGSPLRAVESFDAFSCRGRNNVKGAQMSEHGKANAIDIRSFKLMNGTAARPTDPNVAKDFRDAMRKGACNRFKTVLGPGSDGYHEDHIHVDLAERRADYRICQWDVRQPIYRVLWSPHIVSEATPPAHVSPPSHPVAMPVAAPVPVEEKPRNTRPRRL